MTIVVDSIILVFFTVGNYLNYIDRALTNTYLPEFGREFNLTKTDQAIVSSSYLVGYVIFSFVFCILAHKIKTSILVMCGCLLWSTSCILMFFANKELLYVGRILSGVGEGAYQSLIPAYIEQHLTPKHTSLYVGIYFSGIYIGSAIGIAVGGLTTANWRWAYLAEMVAMLANIVFLFVYSFFEKSDAVELSCAKLGSIFRNIVSSVSWWLVILSYAFFSFTVGAVNTWLPSLVSDKFPLASFSTLQLDLGFVVMISSLIGAVVSGGVIKCLHNKLPLRLHLFTNALATALTLALALIPTYIALAVNVSWPMFLVCMFILLFLITFSTLPINLLIMNLVEAHSKTYSMALSICIIHLIGDIPSPIIAGKIWDMTQNATLAMEISTVGFVLSILLCIPVCYLTYNVTPPSHALVLEQQGPVDDNEDEYVNPYTRSVDAHYRNLSEVDSFSDDNC